MTTTESSSEAVSTPNECPPVLRTQVRRAARMAHVLAMLAQQTPDDDPSHRWLIGRADEVRAVVGSVTREWSENRVDGSRAAARIHDYLRSLQESHTAFVRSSEFQAPRPARDRWDTIIEIDNATIETNRPRVQRRV